MAVDLGNTQVGFTSFSPNSLLMCKTRQLRQYNQVHIVISYSSKMRFNIIMILSAPPIGPFATKFSDGSEVCQLSC